VVPAFGPPTFGPPAFDTPAFGPTEFDNPEFGNPEFDNSAQPPADDRLRVEREGVPGSLVVAIDGPSGSGKSSVSREAARRLGLAYLDTGAMYRAVCWSCLEDGVDLTDESAVAEHARSLDLRIGTDPQAPTVHVRGRDVALLIRATRISEAVSLVARVPAVRAELRLRQREIIDRARRGPRCGCVAEGRDITTVVAPEAEVRLLLTASEAARLARRALEVHGSADVGALAATRDQVLRRDADDSAVAVFHVAADGVLELDSSGLDFEQTVAAVLGVVAERAPVGACRA
jgi:cytidylate kinase